MKFSNFNEIFKIIKNTFFIFKYNDPLRLGAATAFFTTFALPLIILLLLSIFGLIFSTEILTGEIFAHLAELIGLDAAHTINNILMNFQERGDSLLLTIAGGIFLIFVSTTLFMVLQNTINQIWNIRPNPKAGIKKVLKDRAIAFAIILFSGVVFLIVMLSDFLLNLLKDYLSEINPDVNLDLVSVVNRIIALGLFLIWLVIIFRYVPNARVHFKTLWVGAAFTTLLFFIGQYILQYFLVQSDISTMYGAAGSLVIVLLFVFYSSMIFYLGACFIRAYAEQYGYKIRPRLYSFKFQIEEVTEHTIEKEEEREKQIEEPPDEEDED